MDTTNISPSSPATPAESPTTSRYFSGIRPTEVPSAEYWNLYHNQVCLNRLPREHKRQAWEFIKANRPELHQMLTTDPVFKQLRERFGVTGIWVPLEDAGLQMPSGGAP